MARNLEIKPTGQETLSLSGFGDKERRLRHLDTAVIYLESTPEDIPVKVDFSWCRFVLDYSASRGKGPTAIQSKLCYLLSGPLNVPTSRNITPNPVSMMNVFTLHSKEEVDLEKFWKIESMGVEPVTKKQEYEQYLTHYQDTCITYNDGKYIAKLPWREEHDTLPTNELISRRRTENVINRQRKEPKLLHTYGEIIREQEQ
ncbi:uncharacterized protein LOC123525646 [Mercenaria mercenaria]|uniref:uncharacterized protein LOC123525646 n=1 Tax=Mercenaria mercenaria TaxID=6596 RepID=UPI00234EF34E|nr:uncharacterized protein LOC123525646 [Mercenaria mercenaria]